MTHPEASDLTTLGDIGRATQWLDQADRSPSEVVAAAGELLEHTLDPVVEAIAGRALGIAQRTLGRIGEALTAFDRAVDAGQRSDRTDLTGLALTSRAAPRFMSGDMAGGVADLERAIGILDGPDLGIAHFQYAQYLDVVGDVDAGVRFDVALAHLADAPSHAKYRGHALANRGLHHAIHGRLDLAEADLQAALAVWDELGLDALAAAAVHNLGLVEHYRGDFVAAIGHFEAAQNRAEALGHDRAASGRDYCEALLAVGLAGEAFERAGELAAEAVRSGDRMAASELQLLAAHAAIHLERHDDASIAARAAWESARLDGRHSIAALARLALSQAASAAGPADTDEIDGLAAELDSAGLEDAATAARLLAADAALASGDEDECDRRLEALTPTLRSAKPDRRLQYEVIAARRSSLMGDRRAAARHVRSGLAVVDAAHAGVGAIDARTHLSSHAGRLLEIGRDLAAADRDPRRAWSALERYRARSLRQRTVQPVDDEVLGELLTRLRQQAIEIAATEAGTREWQQADRQQRYLQRRVADHVRRTRAAGDGAMDEVTLDQIEARLDGAALVTWDVVGGALLGYVFDGRLRRVEGPSIADVAGRAEATRQAARRLARRTASAHSQRLAGEQLAQLAAWFDAELVPDRTDRPVVIVAPNELAHVPWGLLASLRSRAFTIDPSATVWAAAERNRRARPSAGRGAAFVAGPGLPAAEQEALRSGIHHAQVTTLTHDRATADAVARALATNDLVHLAAHYTPRAGNSLFSAFELADGPWFLHDLTRVAPQPAVWVVPSCESSSGSAPVAGELLGLRAVLLGSGVRSVVMSTGLVPDADETVEAMDGLHRHLAGGESASVALSSVRSNTVLDTPSALALHATLACHGAL